MERYQQIRFFLFSQYLADGIRITLAIAVPAIVFSYLGNMAAGITLSLGAMCVSTADGPGPIVHRKNGMMYCAVFVFISALLTGILNHNIFLLGSFILVASFFFTMFSVYGARASSVGFSALLIMVLLMSDVKPFEEALTESLLILAGGVWYMLVALLSYQMAPYRPAKRALGECIYDTAQYLRIKAEMYNPTSDLDTQYRKLLNQQIVVNTRQDAVRELLFKHRALLKESTHTGRLLVLTFVDVVDLFEHIMATWYDYALLREKYADTGILEDVSEIITHIAKELDDIGEAVQAASRYKKNIHIPAELENLKKKIDGLINFGSTMMLKKILVNLRNLSEKVDEIIKYFSDELPNKKKLRTENEYSRFVSHQSFDSALFFESFTFESSTFRHALRMMICCGIGFFISKIMPQGHHSYWIIMTIIIILKPSYSLTRKKNYDRIMGTLAGAIIGLLLLYLVKDKEILFAFLLFFMIGTYTYKILNYIVMVIFLTPYILILFHFLGLGALNVAGERLVDTIIGSLLAFTASYLLFPQWEAPQVQRYMGNVLKANIHYLLNLKKRFSGEPVSSLEYNLSRKDIFVSTANLSAALTSMMSDPKSRQQHRKEIHQFAVLNHILSSNIASLTAEDGLGDSRVHHEYLPPVQHSIRILEKSLHHFDKDYQPAEQETGISYSKNRQAAESASLPDMQLKEQLDFVSKISSDISKITETIFHTPDK